MTYVQAAVLYLMIQLKVIFTSSLMLTFSSIFHIVHSRWIQKKLRHLKKLLVAFANVFPLCLTSFKFGVVVLVQNIKNPGVLSVLKMVQILNHQGNEFGFQNQDSIYNWKRFDCKLK